MIHLHPRLPGRYARVYDRVLMPVGNFMLRWFARAFLCAGVFILLVVLGGHL